VNELGRRLTCEGVRASSSMVLGFVDTILRFDKSLVPLSSSESGLVSVAKWYRVLKSQRGCCSKEASRELGLSSNSDPGGVILLSVRMW
jgi:hypothetical protein